MAIEIYQNIKKQLRNLAPNSLVCAPYIWHGDHGQAGLCEAISIVFPDEIWKWLCDQGIQGKETENYSMENPFVGGLLDTLNKTKLLSVSPIDPEKYNNATNEEKMSIEADIQWIIDEFQRRINKNSEIRHGVKWSSTQNDQYYGSRNYRVYRFRSESIAIMVEQRIVQAMNDQFADYFICFVSPRKCVDDVGRNLCGFIQKNEGKAYTLHDISEIVQETMGSQNSQKKCRIKLLSLNGCYSYHLAKLFERYIPNIVCIHPYAEIEDEYSIKFNHHFTRNLALSEDIPTAFRRSKQDLREDIKLEFYGMEMEPTECVQVLPI